MNYFRYIALLILTTCCYSVGYAGTEPSASYKIPFTNHGGLILIDAELEGISGVFVFDTGADAVILNSPDQFLSTDSSTEFHTLSGTITASTTIVDELELGEYTFEDIVAYQSDLSVLSSMVGSRLLGILGNNVFSSKVISIDNVNNLIEITDGHQLKNFLSTSKYVQLEMEFVEDLIVIPVELGGTSYKFSLDTGASVSIISEETRIINEALFVKKDKEFSLSTAHADITSEIYEVTSCNLANLRINKLQFGTADLSAMSESLPEDVVGIISLDQLPLSQIVFDFQGQTVYFGI